METVNCPHCQGEIASSEEFQGKRVSCPHCAKQFVMPSSHQQSRPEGVVIHSAQPSRKLIAVLLGLIVVLLFCILVAIVVNRKRPNVNMDDLSADESKSFAGLQMLAVAEDMKPEYSRRLWIFATRLIHDGYISGGKPVSMDVGGVMRTTNGLYGLHALDNGLFPVSWKLARPERGEKKTFPSWLTCKSAGGFCYDMYERMSEEWSKAIFTFPRDDFQAVSMMLEHAADLHSNYTSNRDTFADEIRKTREHEKEFDFAYVAQPEYEMFSLTISKDGPAFRFELQVNESSDGTFVVLQINCVDPDAGYNDDN